YTQIQQQFFQQGWAILSQFINKKIDRDEAERKLRKLFRKYYAETFASGWRASGLADWVEMSDEDWKWLESALQEEFTYLSQFLSDIERGYQVMPYIQRWEMYVKTLDHVYWVGKLSVIPDGFVIDWVISKAEHCKGCIFLRDNSPYTIYTLPTVPRAGTTPCLSNCKCKLRVRKPRSQQEYIAAKNHQKRSLLKILKDIKEGKR
ncbi:MAG: hypothetical protein N2053_08420, partial [Chitinispirillaceae bacterium]|nr:hypothetical protein [Chitinispirillaceae bacterium]